MTTVTAIGEDETPSISVSAKHRISKIDPLIYGGFIEHMGRCIYGGIYDPTNTYGLIDEHGFRTDVQECFKELQVSVVRYPGGNFCATYHWMDGIGPRELRPKRLEPAWQGIETNAFGTDEFLRWCEIVGTEPYLCLNMGTGTLDEAMAWLEYTNSSADTHYANLRRKHGREKPYNVKYWALGNEVWGPWNINQMTAEAYAEKACQWAKALKMIDSTVTLVLCGQDGHSIWDQQVLNTAIRFIDMHSIHIYTHDLEHYPNALAPLAAERAIQTAAATIDIARTTDDYTHFPSPVNTHPRSRHTPKICFDEWNIWSPLRAPGESGAEESYTLSDMLGVSIWLNVFVRQSRHLGMATIAQSVNVISPILTHEAGLVKQTTYWPLYLFSRYMRGHSLAVNVCSPVYQGRTTPEWARSTVDMSVLDVSASVDEEGWVCVAVVNVEEARDFEVEIVTAGKEVAGWRVGGRNFDLGERNTRDEARVVPEEVKGDGKGRFLFERKSLTLLKWFSGVKPGEALYGPAHERGLNVVTNSLVSA